MLTNTVSTQLHEKLRAIDPESADSIHANNVKRVIRALEYYHLTGEKISVHNAREREKESPYDYRYFVLNDKRESSVPENRSARRPDDERRAASGG